ncbi:hypothetical protein OIU74_008144 [Salix koriyanagi]|uniref:Cell differentiation protein rcd1 n=1 Tax=Salix koriyanagi TaxID=2511006 RepID=A0A9Q0Z726_9ROSI|nr:hypothetical protein OIU74_008144 [Salix koriyanagi]
MYRWPELQFESWNPSEPAYGPLDTASVVQLIEALNNDEARERALHLLSKNRANREDLAPLLWYSVGTISILLQEIISVYHSLHSPTLADRVSNRVCDALVLFQCVAANPSTKMPFIEAKLPLYLYPFLNNTNKERPHQFLRLASLSVIGALAKVGDPNIINFLLESEVFPCCLCCMEVGDVLSKTVATYIVYKILTNEEGLRYCCTVAERFFALVRVLGSMVLKLAEEGQLAENPSKRLLKHIIWCYHRLSESPRSCDGLRCCLPVILSDAAFINMFSGEPSAAQHLQQLFHNVSSRTSRIQTIEKMIRPLVRG